MRLFSIFGYVTLPPALALLLSCVPSGEDDNPIVEVPPAPFGVAISLAAPNKENAPRFVLNGEMEGATPCEGCTSGYFTALPFSEHGESIMRTASPQGLVEISPGLRMASDEVSYYRYTYVDQDGYTNSAVARYQQTDEQQPVTVYHQPTLEDASHLEFRLVFSDPIVRAEDIELNYPDERRFSRNIQLGNNNFVSSYIDAIGEREMTFLIELEEDDDRAEGIEIASISITLEYEDREVELDFDGIIFDDDAENIEPADAAPQPLTLNGTEVCPSDQSERLGSEGNVRFSLQWDNPEVDLNLWVKDPCGNTNSHLSSALQCGEHVSARETTEGRMISSENIVWTGAAEVGEYAFAVEHFSGPESDFTLCIYHDSDVQGYRGKAGGGAISEIQTVTVTNGEVGAFASAGTQVEVVDFDFSGEPTEPLVLVNFLVDPVTVVQPVESGDLRAELPFEMDILNWSDACIAQNLDVFITDEEGNRTSTVVIGNNTYKEDLSESPERDKMGYITPSNLLAMPVASVSPFRRNIDIPLLGEVQTLNVEFVFSSNEFPDRDNFTPCREPPLNVPFVSPISITVDVPGIGDVITAESGPAVTFAYPYVVRQQVRNRQYDFRDDVIYLQYQSQSGTETPEDVELHVNRELYRRGLPFSEQGATTTEVDGFFVLQGVGIDFKSYTAPVEFRYIYSREFDIGVDDESRVANYRLALSGRADIFSSFHGRKIEVQRDTLFYYAVYEDYRGGADFDDSAGGDLPFIYYFSYYPHPNLISGSAANDVYHVGGEFRDIDSQGSSVLLEYSDDAAKGFDILSFAEQVNIDEFSYYRVDDDLMIFNQRALAVPDVTEAMEEGPEALAHLFREFVYDYTSQFSVVVGDYFADKPRLIDEFRWNNAPYITHEEILDIVVEL